MFRTRECSEAWDWWFQHGRHHCPPFRSMLCSWKIHKRHSLSNHTQCSHQFEWLAPLLKDPEEQDGELTHCCKKSCLLAHPALSWKSGWGCHLQEWRKISWDSEVLRIRISEFQALQWVGPLYHPWRNGWSLEVAQLNTWPQPISLKEAQWLW